MGEVLASAAAALAWLGAFAGLDDGRHARGDVLQVHQLVAQRVLGRRLIRLLGGGAAGEEV
jgi:hypothetical protein